MKVAITAKSASVDSLVDPRFGRAPFIVIADLKTGEVTSIDNSVNVNAFKGAGINAAASIHKEGVDVLMTGYCGPKAFKVIETAGIKVVSDVVGTVAEAIQRFKTGEISYTNSANAEAHW